MDDSDTLAAQSAAHHAIVAHIIMPSLRENFFPPRKLLRDHHVVQVAATESLYKVFERC
jgi:DNA mismatch repair protein MLH1